MKTTRKWFCVQVHQIGGTWYGLSYWPTRKDAEAEAAQLRQLGRIVRVVLD